MVYRVFLSSTSKDLAAHREAVTRAISGLDGFHPIVMETFGARDATASQIDEAKIRECDVFVGLVGHCYGSSPKDNPTSYTEQEFDLATALGRPRLMLVATDEFKLPANLIEPEAKRQRQAAFRARVLEGRVVARFDDPAGLAGLVTQALANWRGEREKATKEPIAAKEQDAIPPPTLTLGIAFESEGGRRWKIRAEHPDKKKPVKRTQDVPWLDKPEFASAFSNFWKLSRQELGKDEDRRILDAAARTLGEALVKVLLPEEIELLRVAARGDPPPPLLVIESDDDLILALPWELLRIDGSFAVAEGRLDVARSVSAKGAPVLGPPKESVTLVVNVAAPEGGGLNYEAESYAITRALHDHVGVRVNELGELGDLLAGLRADPAPIGVHFSGHGGPGTLLFEDAYGGEDSVPVAKLATEIRRSAPERFPRFFYLACCHGGDPPALTRAGQQDGAKQGLSATATALHREGVTQVVGYFGPVYDILSTWAEGAFYGEIGRGRRTRDALRAARDQMTRPLKLLHRAATRDGPGAGVGAGNPFAWAQLVLYQRGPDHPLGTAVTRKFAETAEAELRRVFEQKGERSRLLRTGFIGRRKELHRLRRDLNQGKTIHVVQGLGGIGKSALCGEALKLYHRQGRDLLYLWCAEVEDAPDPVGILLRQLSDQLEARFGEAWNGVVAAIDRMAAAQPGLQQPAARLVAYLSVVLQQEETPPFALYLDNLESLQQTPGKNEERPSLGATSNAVRYGPASRGSPRTAAGASHCSPRAAISRTIISIS
jgi:hypothetical protein